MWLFLWKIEAQPNPKYYLAFLNCGPIGHFRRKLGKCLRAHWKNDDHADTVYIFLLYYA